MIFGVLAILALVIGIAAAILLIHDVLSDRKEARYWARAEELLESGMHPRDVVKEMDGRDV